MKFRHFAIALSAAFCLFCCTLSLSGAEGKVIVSLGDSYSSGEGIEPFYGQEEEMAVKCQNPDWLAHRSEKSWPGLLTLPGVSGTMSEHRGENWFFTAATTAETDQLFLLTAEETAAGMTAEKKREYRRDGISGTGILPPQLDVFDELDERGLKADYVTVTIGGNDIGFQSLIKLAMVEYVTIGAGKAPEEKADLILDEYYRKPGVRAKIKRAYTDIAARAGDQAYIIVAGYPRLLEPGKKKATLFTEKSIQIMNRTADLFNQELRSIVEECRGEGMNICFVPVDGAFEGHGAYADDPWINPVLIGSRKQDLKQMMPASYYSMHPNEEGAQAYAACVQEEINRHEAEAEK